MRGEVTGMAEEQQARTYIMAASEAEHARLVAIARRFADQVREMCARAGVGTGARVVDARSPRYAPRVPASERAWELLYAAAHRRGAAGDVARRLPALCAEAGLRVLDARGTFRLLTPA